MPDTFWIQILQDGEWPDEMNTRLVGPLPDGDLPREPDLGSVLFLVPESYEDWLAHEIEMEEEV